MKLFMEDHVVVEGYNSKTLAAWEEELKTVTAKIKEIEPLAIEAMKKVATTDSSLLEKETQVAHLNGDIARIVKGTIIDSSSLSATMQILMEIKNTIFSILGDPEVKAIKEEKNAIIKRRDELQKEESKKRKIYNQYELELKTLNKRKKFLQREIPRAKEFLPALKDNPKVLVLQLVNNIKASLNDFNQRHPKQDIHVRLCLYKLNEKLNKIIKKNTDDPEEWRIRYAEVCGFLWDLLHQFQHKNYHRDLEFFNLLKSNLEETHISENSDLPDDMKTNVNCLEHFEQFKKLHPEIYSLSPENELYTISPKDLISEEQKEAQDALKELHHLTQGSEDPLYKEFRELANEVDKEINKKRKPHAPLPDYKLYTRVLDSGNKFLTNGSEAAFTDFCDLKKYVSGQPSFSKKVLGLMSGIVTTVLTTACAVTAVALFATGNPLGLPMAIAASTAAKGAAVIGTGISIGLAGASFSLFGKGLRKGISAEMQKIEAIKNNRADADLESELNLKFA